MPDVPGDRHKEVLARISAVPGVERVVSAPSLPGAIVVMPGVEPEQAAAVSEVIRAAARIQVSLPDRPAEA